MYFERKEVVRMTVERRGQICLAIVLNRTDFASLYRLKNRRALLRELKIVSRGIRIPVAELEELYKFMLENLWKKVFGRRKS